MTIALQYLDDLSRVRITITDWPDGTVQVQRSLNPNATDAVWERGIVRGGRALPVSGGTAVLDDYEFVPDVPNYYRVVPIDPPAGLLLTGQAGDYASTPDDASLDITGDLTLVVDATPAGGWDSPAANQVLIAKYVTTGNNRSYRLRQLASTGILRFNWSPDGTNLPTADSSAPVSDVAAEGRLAVAVEFDVDVGGASNQAAFYTAATADGPWAQLGDPATAAGTTSIFSGSAELSVGAQQLGTSEPFTGIIHRAKVIAGSLATGDVRCDVDFTKQPFGTTSFEDDTGLTWTVHGNALIVGAEMGSITPSLDGKVWLKSVRYPMLNRPLFRVLDQGDDIARPDRGSVHEVTGRAAPLSVEDVQGSRRFNLLIQAEDDEDAAALEIALQVGGVLFVHVPPDKPVPGGYVHVGQVRRQRPTTLVRHRFVVPCTVVAKPSPDVVGTTLTVGQLIAQHDSIESVWAAYPSIRDMWDDIGDINDLVVI